MQRRTFMKLLGVLGLTPTVLIEDIPAVELPPEADPLAHDELGVPKDWWIRIDGHDMTHLYDDFILTETAAETIPDWPDADPEEPSRFQEYIVVAPPEFRFEAHGWDMPRWLVDAYSERRILSFEIGQGGAVWKTQVMLVAWSFGLESGFDSPVAAWQQFLGVGPVLRVA